MTIFILKRVTIALASVILLILCGFLLLYFPLNAPLHHLTLPHAFSFYADHLLNGNLGFSIVNNHTFITTLKLHLATTVELFLGAYLIAILIGVPLGIFSAIQHHKWQGKLTGLLALINSACSVVLLSVVLISIFCYQLKWLPNNGLDRSVLPSISGFFFIDIWFYQSPHRNQILFNGIQHFILPIAVLSFYTVTLVAYFVEKSAANVLKQNYIKIAVIRDLSFFKIIYQHLLPNALLPIIPQLMLYFSHIFFLTMIVEIIFDWNGIGTLIMQAYKSNDLITITGSILLTSVIIVVINFLGNVISAIINHSQYKDENIAK